MSRHAGLGSAGAAPNLPTPANIPTGPRYSMFLSQIPLDFADLWLENLLSAAGPLVSMRRVRDAAGMAKPFGFAEYSDLESVLRCLQCINGLKLPSKVSPDQPFAVKADKKTQESLDEYQSSRVESDDHQEALQMTQNTVRDVLGAITSSAPNATPASALAAAHDALTQGRTHLQDLGPDDLPEQSRGQITKEIAFFREQAAKREQARRDQADKERNAAPGNAHSGGTGSSAPSRDARDRFGRPDSRGPPPPSSGGRYGDDSAHRQPEMGRSQRQWGRPQTEDPQSYRNGTTPGFVRGSSRSQQDEAAREEQDVYSQQDHQKRRREQMFRDRERQWEHREKQRAHHNQREVARDNGMARDEEAGAKSMLRRLEDWDEQSEARDPFYSDRNRWRAQRRAFRAREKDNDAQDARREKEQLAEIQKQSDAFLASQSDIFASLSGQPGKKTGGAAKDEDGTASGGPIKLGDRSKAKAKPAEQPEKPKPRAAAFASAEDEEEQGRKKRQLIPLDYSELEHGEDAGLTDQQIADRRKKRIQEIVTSIPTDKNGLWTWTVDWAYLTDTMLQEKLKPFIGKKVVDIIGDEDSDLVSECLSHLEAHKSAAALAEEMEPVFADEAEEFVIKIWRFLIFETLASKNNVSTTAAA